MVEKGSFAHNRDERPGVPVVGPDRDHAVGVKAAHHLDSPGTHIPCTWQGAASLSSVKAQASTVAATTANNRISVLIGRPFWKGKAPPPCDGWGRSAITPRALGPLRAGVRACDPRCRSGS